MRIKSSGEVFYHYRAKVSHILTSPHFVTSLISSFSVVEEEIERDPKTDRQEIVQFSDNIAGTLGGLIYNNNELFLELIDGLAYLDFKLSVGESASQSLIYINQDNQVLIKVVQTQIQL